jgi:D-alanyl-D-alanine carboxypeptidase (penicillin-binding protein 5/6)
MKFKKYTIIFFVIAALAIGTYLFRSYNGDTTPLSIRSPLPDLFTNNQQQVLSYQEYWKPIMKSPIKSTIKVPEISAQSALIYDTASDSVLVEKDSNKRLPIASITKIMTAIVIIENENLDELVTVSKRASSVGENSMMLKEDEKFTRRDLLYGLILPSGNDAAEVLAETSSVGRENFIYLMNKKAEQLGLTDTHFTNPSGLEGDGNQYSTGHDLLVITRYGLSLHEFAKVVSTVEYEITEDENHGYYRLFNDTNLLTSYPGVKGVKTGFTNEAGMCLVTFLDYRGHKIIGVLLNSENRRQEMKDLLDYSLETLGTEPPIHI